MTEPGNEMTCRELVELVGEYLDGALNATDRARFDAHLKTCEGCRTYLEQFRTTVGLTTNVTDESLEPRVRDALLESFRDWKRGGKR